AAATYWIVDYIDPTPDIEDWHRRLNAREQTIVACLLSLLASSKGVHSGTIWRYFAVGSRVMETRYFFAVQMVMENTHMECCSRFLWSFLRDGDARQRVYDDLSKLSYIRERAAWTSRWFESLVAPYHLRLFAFAASQAVSYSIVFAVLLWIEERALLPSLAQCNRLMATDGGVLIRYARELALLLEKCPCQHLAEEVVVEAVEIEKRFLSTSLTLSHIGLDEKDVSTFIEYTADRLLDAFGYQKKYHSANPLPFAQLKPLHSDNDFFALRESSYA
ncbi:ferritin-like protein, partial [Auricularia subglabra TFB-10046 SS5]